MPWSASQIVSNATQVAGVPGFTSQAGQLLNMILSDLCQTYDLDVAKKTTTLALGTTSGPYNLPADYLRALPDDLFYVVSQEPYTLTPIDLAEFDAMPTNPGNTYPSLYATDMSQSPPQLYVWPPAGVGIVLTIRYFSQMPDITTPQTSLVWPWFPTPAYLFTRLAGELMRIADDDRAERYLGKGDSGAQGILNRYLKMKDDKNTRTEYARLDRRYFKPGIGTLRQTKAIPW